MTAQLKELWIEHEHFEGENVIDFFNMEIRLTNGRRYALNVWTFDYAAVARSEIEAVPRFSIGPDLLVERADRESLESVVRTLIAEESLQPHWLLPDKANTGEED